MKYPVSAWIHEEFTSAGIPVDGVAVTNGNLVTIHFRREATPEQQAQAHAIIAAWDFSPAGLEARYLLEERNSAKQVIAVEETPLGKLVRAELQLTVNELNVLRQWLTGFKAQVAAASNLADLKARVAALPALPDRTKEQATAAILNLVE